MKKPAGKFELRQKFATGVGALLICLYITGCGTIMTRMADDGGIGETVYGNDSFGIPPYAAVVEDFIWVRELFRARNYSRLLERDGLMGRLGLVAGLCGLCALPVDVVCDTVFLPVDLIAWPFGCDKRDTGQKPLSEIGNNDKDENVRREAMDRLEGLQKGDSGKDA